MESLMTMKYTAEEIAALDKKLNNPTETVVCPRCGRNLIFKAYKSACEIKCESENCLRGIVRGI